MGDMHMKRCSPLLARSKWQSNLKRYYFSPTRMTNANKQTITRICEGIDIGSVICPGGNVKWSSLVRE